MSSGIEPRVARLLYVTDLERQLSGGGSYSVNWHAANQLDTRFHVVYAGPLVPRPPWLETSVSKMRRHLLNRAGRFTYFSPATLDGNARMVSEWLSDDIDAVVFRSSARWCRSRPRVPYFVYLDAVFHTFYHNRFESESFDHGDLQRIWSEEAAFLENAAGVFFESEWGLDRARQAYGLTGPHYHAPGRGGVIDPPATDTWIPGTRALLTVAMNFRQKGGDVVLDAYRSLKPRFPSLTWNVVGALPDGDWQSVAGITHEGMLDVDDPEDRARFAALLSRAFTIVHPTREDTSPLVLTEAAYFGCPAISINRFAIPELVDDGATGILIDPPPSAADVASAISHLIDDENGYLAMRREARARAIARHSWPSIGKFICDTIEKRISA